MTDPENTTSNNDAALDAFLDAGAQVLAEVRQDWRREKQLIAAENRELQVNFDALLTPLRQEIAKLQGQVSVLLNSEAGTTSSTKSKRAKQSPANGNGRLLEHQRAQ